MTLHAGAIPGEVRIVDHVPNAFAELIVQQRIGSLAISGGSTARRCYEQLAVTEGINWGSLEVFISDERWVPVDDSDSNEGVARHACLDGVHPAEVYSLRHAAGDHADIDMAAEAYEARLRAHAPIDVCHLGFGSDGHTASLFPGSPALDERERWVIASGDHLHPWPRLTFTFPAIAHCRTVIVTVAGAEKAAPLAQLAAGADFPAAHLAAADSLIWLVDHPAAADIIA
jgi:6-phosphogluconolactonase